MCDMDRPWPNEGDSNSEQEQPLTEEALPRFVAPHRCGSDEWIAKKAIRWFRRMEQD